jgi:hypothetical protein
MDKRPDHLLVGHNLRNFDLPMINILCKQTHRQNVLDSLILSKKLGYIAAGHGLAAWALRLDLEKIEFNDYSKPTKEMKEYCKQDVVINERLYLFLIS